MGSWDVLLFNIANLGPRWVRRGGAQRNFIDSVWGFCRAAVLCAFRAVINGTVIAISRRGGLYVWARKRSRFHGFGPDGLLDYTVFYFPGLLLATAAMERVHYLRKWAALRKPQFLLSVSVGMLVVRSR